MSILFRLGRRNIRTSNKFNNLCLQLYSQHLATIRTYIELELSAIIVRFSGQVSLSPSRRMA